MKICIVGGTGNISSAIVHWFNLLGHEVTIFNRGKTKSARDGCKQLIGGRHIEDDFVTWIDFFHLGKEF